MASRVIHFEIPAEDPDRAVAFYRDAFGWAIEKWEGPVDYWLAATGVGEPGIDGAIMRRGGVAAAVVNTVNVDDIEAAMGRVRAAGGEVAGEIQEIPGVGQHVYCRDTEGHLLGLMQPVV